MVGSSSKNLNFSKIITKWYYRSADNSFKEVQRWREEYNSNSVTESIGSTIKVTRLGVKSKGKNLIEVVKY